MNWVSGWGHALAGAGGVIGNGATALFDLGKAAGTHDLGDAHDNWNQMLIDVGKTISGVGEGLGVLGPPIAWTLKKDYEIYSDWISRPISAAVTTSSIATSERYRQRLGHRNNFFGEWATMFDPDAWKEGWRIAEHRSPGEAITYAIATEDIANQQEMKDAEQQWWFHLVSGSIDATTSMMMDPLYLGAKTARLGRLGRSTTSVNETLSKLGATREVNAGSAAGRTQNEAFLRALQPDLPAGATNLSDVGPTPTARMLRWIDKQAAKYPDDPLRAARTIEKHPVLRGSANGGLLATMLAQASPQERGLIMRIAWGDGNAYKILDARRPALAYNLAGAYNARKWLIQTYAATRRAGLMNPAMRATFKGRISAAQRLVKDLEYRERWLDDLIGVDGTDKAGLLGSLDKMPKRGYGTIAEKSAEARAAITHQTQRTGLREMVHFYDAFSTPVRLITAPLGRLNYFLQDRPTGWLDTNDPQGWRELERTLQQAKGISDVTRNYYVASYMRATSESEKLAIAKDAEEQIIRSTARRYGIPDDDAHGVLNTAVRDFFWQRDKMRATITNRAYSGAMNDKNRRVDFIDDTDVPTAVHPLVATQLANKIPLLDPTAVDRAFARSQNVLRGSAGKWLRDPAVNIGDIFSAWWKVTSLLRLGYMVRVLGDDELAYLAKLGAMTAVRPYGRGMTNFVMNRVARQQVRLRNASQHLDEMSRYWSGRAGGLADEALRAVGYYTPFDVAAKQVARVAGGMPSRAWIPKSKSYDKRFLGQEDFQHTSQSGRVITAQGWAPKGDVGNYWRSIGAEDRFFMDTAEDTRLRAMRREWVKGLVHRGESNFYESWAHALNTQLGRDEMGRMFLGGADVDAVVYWLKRDPVGRAYAKRFPVRAHDPRGWAENVKTFVDWYAPTPELRAAALTGKVTIKDLKKVPDDVTPHQVHGAMLDFNMGKGAASEILHRFRENFYRYMNQIPTDVLVRHPLTGAVYQHRLGELIDIFQRSGARVRESDLRKLENQARSHAVNEARKVVLDLSTHSNMAHVFRFIAPFYNAWDKALRRWGRLAYGNPEILFAGNRLWQGVNNMPVVIGEATNRPGDVEDSEGKILYSGEKNEFTGLEKAGEQLMTFRLPASMAKKLGVEGDYDLVQIPKSSLNLVLQGDPWWMPGFGPMVQIPVSNMVRDKPEAVDMVKSMLPFGPHSVKDLVFPTGLRKLESWQNTEDEQYSATKINIWRTRYARWLEAGRPGPAPDPNDPAVSRAAQRVHGLRFVAQMILPVNARLNTPYKFYLDEYHKLMLPPAEGGVGPENARDAFIQKYPDFFLFAESISQNNAGLPPTVKAWQATKRYKDLLAKTPDIAPAVIGPDAALGGGFNSAVYSQQFAQHLSPSSSKTVRQRRDLATFAKEGLANEGWRRFKKANDLIRIILTNRGLESLQQSGAEDLAQIKGLLVERLKEQYPDWFEEYSAFNPQKQESIIRQLTALAEAKRLPAIRTNPGGDIFQLRNYLLVRGRFLGELRQRKAAGGSGDIRAQSNEDLQQQWRYERDRLAMNTKFSDVIFDRYLTNDEWLRV